MSAHVGVPGWPMRYLITGRVQPELHRLECASRDKRRDAITMGSRTVRQHCARGGRQPAEPVEVIVSKLVTLIRSRTWLAGLLLAFTPLAFANHMFPAVLEVDPGIYDVRAPTAAPTRAGVALAFDGSAIQVHLVASGSGTLPDANLGFAGETPRIAPFDQVHLRAALDRSPKVQNVAGGVLLEHRNTSVRSLRDAYVSAMAEFGFTLEAGANGRIWHFTNGEAGIRVSVAPIGKNVQAYVGR